MWTDDFLLQLGHCICQWFPTIVNLEINVYDSIQLLQVFVE